MEIIDKRGQSSQVFFFKHKDEGSSNDGFHDVMGAFSTTTPRGQIAPNDGPELWPAPLFGPQPYTCVM